MQKQNTDSAIPVQEEPQNNHHLNEPEQLPQKQQKLESEQSNSERKQSDQVKQDEPKKVIDREVVSQQNSSKSHNEEKRSGSASNASKQQGSSQSKHEDQLISINSNYFTSPRRSEQQFRNLQQSVQSGQKIEENVCLPEQIHKISQENISSQVIEIPLPTFTNVKSEDVMMNESEAQGKKFALQESTKVEESIFSQKSSKKQMAMIQNNVSIVIPPKHEPLDLKTLSVLTISSRDKNSSIKPPSPKGEKKLKPWQKMKKKAAQQSTKDNQQLPAKTVSAITSFNQDYQTSLNNQSISVQTASGQGDIDKKESNIPADPSTQKVQVNINIKTDGKPKQEQMKSELDPLKNPVEPSSPKIQILRQETPQKAADSSTRSQVQKQKQQQHQHPFLRNDIFQPQVNIKPVQYGQPLAPGGQNTINHKSLHQLIQNNNHEEISQQNLSRTEFNQIQQIAREEEQPLKLSQKVDLNEVEQERNGLKIQQLKKKLEQLESQIKMQRNISQQLEIQTPVSLKLAISMATGAVVGGAAYIFRKKKLSSMVLGVATAVSTFLLTK